MTTNFLEIDHDATVIAESVNAFLPDATWKWIPFMTVSTNFKGVGKEIANNDTLLKLLVEKFNGALKLYKFPGNSVYKWHKDAFVGCSLNMVLENYNCHTLFSTDFQHNNIFKVEELVYVPKKFYLFNSQTLHTVINLDPRERILVTIIFDKSVSFETIKNWLETEYKN
jgi:hypothetical protein